MAVDTEPTLTRRRFEGNNLALEFLFDLEFEQPTFYLISFDDDGEDGVREEISANAFQAIKEEIGE